MYTKGPVPLERLRELIPRATTNVLRLPNLGRESHTYLHHILENYDELPEVLLLLPGTKKSRGLGIQAAAVLSTCLLEAS